MNYWNFMSLRQGLSKKEKKKNSIERIVTFRSFASNLVVHKWLSYAAAAAN